MNSSLVRAYVGLGSNLNHPVRQIRSALASLDAITATCCVAYSSLYRSKPHFIEEQHGRVRDGERWGPRTLDLDLLLYGDQTHEGDALTVPHPGLPVRDFVLFPLHEIAPELHIPGAGSLANLMARCPPPALQAMHATV